MTDFRPDGDESAPVGSEPWLRWAVTDLREAVDTTKVDVFKVRQSASRVLDDGRFREIPDRHGRRYWQWEEFCRVVLNVREQTPAWMALMDAARRARAEGPLAPDPQKDPDAAKEQGETGGRPAKDEEKPVDNDKQVSKGGTGKQYVLRRLLRDAPQIFEAFERGEYQSARAAGIAAGIVKVPTPIQRFQRAWRRLSEEERAQAMEWLDSEGASSYRF